MASQGPRDPDTVSALQNGEIAGLESLYDRYSKVAFSLAYRILNDRTAAEDTVQEAFLGIWRNAQRFDPQRGTLRNWVLSIVHHRAISRLRGSARRSRRDIEISAVENELELPDAWEQVSMDLQRDAIRQALARLPPEQRQTIELAYFGGLTHVEIAERMGVPLGTVKGRLRIGLERLRADVAQVAWGVADDGP